MTFAALFSVERQKALTIVQKVLGIYKPLKFIKKIHYLFLYSLFSCFFPDYCSKVNCLQGASCRNSALKAVCDCPTGYTGQICETGWYMSFCKVLV